MTTLQRIGEVDAYYNHTARITIYREFGRSPNGNDFGGAWVYRNNGTYIDHDKYRSDLAERHSFVLGDLEV